MLAVGYILIVPFATQLFPSFPNNSQQKNITSSSVILIGFSCRAEHYKIPAQQQAVTLGAIQDATDFY